MKSNKQPKKKKEMPPNLGTIEQRAAKIRTTFSPSLGSKILLTK